ncbi:MAG TPA: SDR family oxidoreductase [Kineosporiaceae bacterium]|nr:SDR family oxidoreductase [Kineosporiaceae bacterium]
MRIPRPIGGKVVVITGAARGIGEALAVALAGRGARVALLGLEPDRLAQVAERCGPNAAWWECDVTDPDALAEAVEGVRQRFHRVDVLVCNAGIAIGGTVLLSDPVSFDRVIEVNLLGSIRTVRAFLPLLVSAHGYYLQIASLAAMAPGPLMSAYDASKSGVEAFALALRTEVAHHGVDAGVAYLSFTDTDMTRGAGLDGGSEDLRQQLPGPLGRLYELGPAVERLVAGIERRAPFVYGQAFIRWLRPLRWLLPSAAYWTGRRGAAHAEQAMTGRAMEASQPVGAGGRADTEARNRHPSPLL